jgi:hypothetical protein
MKLGRIILMLVVFAPLSFAQGYYPLQVGNQWDYGEIRYMTPGQYQYLYSVRVVGDTTMPDGLSYAVLEGDFGAKFLRQSGARVSSFLSNKDSILYNFSLQSGDTLSIVRMDTFYTLVQVAVDQAQIFGKTLKAWTFVTTTNTSSDGGSRRTIADSIGRTYLFVDGGYTDYLMGAIIDGRQYGTITSVPRSRESRCPEFILYQNYPNPFNPRTTVQYYVPVHAEISLILYSVLGQQVMEVDHGMRQPGMHVARVDGTSIASGVYYLRLVGQGVSVTRMIALLK